MKVSFFRMIEADETYWTSLNPEADIEKVIIEIDGVMLEITEDKEHPRLFHIQRKRSSVRI
jgi:hypothetical protein